MNEFEMLARQGYPMDRLMEIAGADVPGQHECPECGAPDFNCECHLPEPEEPMSKSLKELTADLERPSVQLVGTDGNAFSVMAVVRRACRKAGWPAEALDALIDEMTAGDYNHLLATAMEYTDAY